ncbi:MAG TPA: D-cysteine desulfhydrase family protein [Vicinamibacterales bacterium]|nr:D-cysteine desulfhydrase family protein [Vicinamibacterales bacterium]
MATAFATMMAMPAVPLAPHVTPVDDLVRLRAALGSGAPRILVKRDDLLSFGLGGNKVRKMQTVAAEARATGADTLITAGGLQSNHCRVTAATGAALGMHVVLVLSGEPPASPTANTRLDRLFGAEIRFVPSRAERVSTMAAVADELRAAGRHPFVVPIGASTPTGALGFARGVVELSAAGVRPDEIVHATSTGGTQAGLVAGCALVGLSARVIGVSADEPAPALQKIVAALIEGIADRLGARPETVGADRPIEVADDQVGDGYGVPTAASTEALELFARREGLLLDPVYTAKAAAGMLARIRSGEFTHGQTVLFWHTGGQVAFFQ